MKKFSSIVLVLCMFVALLIPMTTTVSALTSGDFTYTMLNGEATITEYTGSAEELIIPSMLGGYPVTSIGAHAFSFCRKLASVTIPDSVTSIGDGAFSDCYNLASVTIPDSVTSIGDGAFSYCYNLTSVTIPEGVTSIGGFAFAGCDGLTSVTIPEGVTNIGEHAFDQCSGLMSVAIPESVTSIENGAFLGCFNLKELYIADIGAWCEIVFEGSDSRPVSNGTNVYIDGKLATDIVIPDSVTSIGDNALAGFSSLTSVTIPESVTSIGDSVFSNCSSLTSVTIPESVTSIGDGAFSNCSSLTSVTIPEGVTSIGRFVFAWCSGLTSVTIPEGVTSIENGAFLSCSSLTSITIPDSVTSIIVQAFGYCSSLKDVYYQGSADSWSKIYIEGFNEELTNANIHFAPNDYSFGQSVQIGLIEPWFLKANVRVYTEDEPTNIDYSTLVDYGAYFIRKSELDVENATQDTLEISDIINDSDAVKYSKSAGTATIDGSYITANYDKGLYTYEFDDSIFVLFYIEDENGITYVPIRERNLKKLLEDRKDDVENFPNEYERNVYQNMLNMYNSVKQYRDDYYKNN